MVLRVRHPGTKSKDRDLGPALARLTPYDAMRRAIDVALCQAPRKIEPVIWDARR